MCDSIALPKTCGFTTLELLVAIAIISIVAALLLPAIQSARESARQLECQNKLRQIALATQHFESTHRHLPSNGWGYRWIGDPQRGVGKRQPGGWVFQLARYCQFEFRGRHAHDPVSQYHLRTELSQLPFALLRCPSRPSSPLLPASLAPAPVNASFMALVPKTDYAVNEGDFITDTDGGPNSLAEGDRSNFPWTPTTKATGVIFLRSELRLGQVTDGLSQTYLCGEKYVNSAHYFDSQDPGYDQSLFSGVDLDLNRWTVSPPSRDGKSTQERIFGSAHARGFSMAWCDGSVRLVDYSVDANLHREFGNRQDHR